MIELILQNGFFISLALFLGGAIASIAFDKQGDSEGASTAAHIFAALGSFVGLVFGSVLLLTGETLSLHAAFTLGFAPSVISLKLDALSAFFICVISLVAFAASVYGIGYQKQFVGHYRLGNFGFFYNLFLASMALVIAANNALLFLFAWELMAIASYFLVVFERKEEENVRAGVLYILVTQLGTAFLFGAFLLLYGAGGSWDFDAMRMATGGLSFTMQNVILALALIGFGTKAGIIPLHIWLPEAHPAAPSHVSALMSGVMIKTAIFMLMRVFLDFFPVVSPTWGLIILGLGAISSLLGVLYALSEHDIKRLLAFHSVENIGIILLGLGAAVTFFSYGATVLGILALSAALYHTVNHALFKGLLFLSAGSVVHATHTRNMEEYGGLIRKMPWTAFFFLIGAIAISGLPPLNGFVSEWLTFQGLFVGIASLPLAAKIVFLVGAASLAFTGGLAAACFVKAFGATFLARPRGHVYEHAHECGSTMKFGMGFLAVFIVALGVGASSVTPVLASVVMRVRGLGAETPFFPPTEALSLGNFSSLSMMGVALAMVLGFLVTFIVVQMVTRNRRVVINRTWDCGAPLNSRMEITATSFSRSIITIFHALLRPAAETNVEYHDATVRYFAKSKSVHLSLPDLYRSYLYRPAALFIEKSAHRVKLIQTGNLNAYILYMFVTLVVLLWWAST
jgi:hydrogenase-4 component B